MGCVLSLLKSYKDLEVFIFVLDFLKIFFRGTCFKDFEIFIFALERFF